MNSTTCRETPRTRDYLGAIAHLAALGWCAGRRPALPRILTPEKRPRAAISGEALPLLPVLVHVCDCVEREGGESHGISTPERNRS
jgi:hypothetical protein